MNIAFVVPRYGPRVHGGAEGACRALATHLAGDAGWSVQILTTTAVDAQSWIPGEPAGASDDLGVRVMRFPAAVRHSHFADLHRQVTADPHSVSEEDHRRWLEWQGPVSPDLLEAVADCAADVIALTPYLFHPTVDGIQRARRPTILHPAAHDEPAARLPLFRTTMAKADGLCFYSDSERRMAGRVFGSAHHRQLVLGVGVDPIPGDPAAFRSAYGLGDDPYLLCVGRVDASKGATALARMFAAYKQEQPGPLRLVFVGQVVENVGLHPDVLLTGSIDDSAKWGALRGATALVSPSRFESFSLVLLESWLAGTPVLVNQACGPTREHVARSGGGLAFSGYLTFEAAVDALLRDGERRRRIAARGTAYVEERFRWPIIIDRYAAFAASLAK